MDILAAMKPVRKGLYLTVAVDEGLHKQGVLELRDSLIGRVTHVRGDKPLVQSELIKKLTAIWGIRSPWSLIPIGEGFYNFQFTCGDDRERIFAKLSWQIKPGLLRLQCWVQDFNPYKVSTSVAQVWIRISELPLEYWNNNIITTLASAVGTVIKLDERTASRSMGRFARVLVELDLKQDREENVMFERAGYRSVVYIQYERLPEFCNYCNVMGHSTGNCGTYHNPKQGNNKSASSDPKVGSKIDPPTGGTKQGVQRTFGSKPPDSGPSPLDKGDTLAPCSSTAPFIGTKQWVQKTFPSASNRDQNRDQMPDTGQGDHPGLQCRNSFAVLEETDDGETEMVDSDTAYVVVDVDDSVAGVVTITREDQLQVQLPPIEEDNARTSLSPLPTGDIGSEEHPKSRRQRAPLVAKEYNLQN
ncbi:hypothetical protein ACS0TY_012669 [Phlomoides rotata]